MRLEEGCLRVRWLFPNTIPGILGTSNSFSQLKRRKGGGRERNEEEEKGEGEGRGKKKEIILFNEIRWEDVRVFATHIPSSLFKNFCSMIHP